MRSIDIRSTFLDYFTSRGHVRVPSSSLVPDDPTLLLTNAGMNQFKPLFLGEVTPPHPRAVSVQKCVRTSDIDNVGLTTRHATFFEMLGSFAFGDYFKEQTISYAWELLTEHYGLDPDRLWVTVYLDDDESIDLWRGVGVPAGRIQRLGMADNFWSMGVPGPCGPSSELHYDRGPAFGEPGGPAVDGERHIELWNLVFMQSLRGEGAGKGDYPVLGDLPSRNIDTGLGLDRLAVILQGVDTVCETDLLRPTLDAVEELSGRRFPGRLGGPEAVSFQVVAEHSRSAAFLIADGVLPSNEGRGYVLRRLMRRAIRHARTLGIEGWVLPTVTGSVVDNLGGAWPELVEQRSLVEAVTAREEEAFGSTLRQGSRLLDSAITRAKRERRPSLPGETAFELHDTYGFPIDLTLESARAAGLGVDEERYASLLDEQRRRAKKAGRGRTGAAVARQDSYRELLARHGRTEFVGYRDTAAQTPVLGILRDGLAVPAAGQGQEVELILARSPFYAESGGQVGDTGTLRTGDGTTVEITDTRLGLDGFHVHTGVVRSGELVSGTTGEALVDTGRRAATERSHSATHVLHAMLRRTLGGHARQQGSLVAPGRLRFDFSHHSPIDPARLAAIGMLVNDYLLDDPEVRVWTATRQEAEAAGATAFFGEKYGDEVRIVDIGDASRELCGGTHVGHGTQAGPVRILGEASIGSGVRRIEALTGRDALVHADHERVLLDEVRALVGARPDQLVASLQSRLAALARAESQLRAHRRGELDRLGGHLVSRRRRVGDGWLVSSLLEDVSPAESGPLASEVLSMLTGPSGSDSAVVVLAMPGDGKAQLVAAVSDRLAVNGDEARRILAEAGSTIGGGAGGTGTLAHAGGSRANQVAQALRQAESAAHELLTLAP